MDPSKFGRVEWAGPGHGPTVFDPDYDLDPTIFDDELDFDGRAEKNPEIEDDANKIVPMERQIIDPVGEMVGDEGELIGMFEEDQLRLELQFGF